MENKIRAEIDEEEKKILVIGFPITTREHEAIIPLLIASMMRENVRPREDLSIDWMKDAVNGKEVLS